MDLLYLGMAIANKNLTVAKLSRSPSVGVCMYIYIMYIYVCIYIYVCVCKLYDIIDMFSDSADQLTLWSSNMAVENPWFSSKCSHLNADLAQGFRSQLCLITGGCIFSFML